MINLRGEASPVWTGINSQNLQQKTGTRRPTRCRIGRISLASEHLSTPDRPTKCVWGLTPGLQVCISPTPGNMDIGSRSANERVYLPEYAGRCFRQRSPPQSHTRSEPVLHAQLSRRWALGDQCQAPIQILIHSQLSRLRTCLSVNPIAWLGIKLSIQYHLLRYWPSKHLEPPSSCELESSLSAWDPGVVLVIALVSTTKSVLDCEIPSCQATARLTLSVTNYTFAFDAWPKQRVWTNCQDIQ